MSLANIELTKVKVEPMCMEFEAEQLMAHVKLEPHDTEDVYKFTGEDTFIGHAPINIKEEKMDVTTLTRIQLEPHIKPVMSKKSSSTHGDKQCQYCSKMCPSISKRFEHENSHTGEKPHKCEHCDKWFTQKSSVNLHVKCVHEGVRPHQCKECAVRFSRKTNLDKHVRSIHRGERHECSVCIKTFSSKQYLSKHSLIHSGVKPHKCEVCGSTFRQTSHLNRHVRSAHRKEHQ